MLTSVAQARQVANIQRIVDRDDILNLLSSQGASSMTQFALDGKFIFEPGLATISFITESKIRNRRHPKMNLRAVVRRINPTSPIHGNTSLHAPGDILV